MKLIILKKKNTENEYQKECLYLNISTWQELKNELKIEFGKSPNKSDCDLIMMHLPVDIFVKIQLGNWDLRIQML